MQISDKPIYRLGYHCLYKSSHRGMAQNYYLFVTDKDNNSGFLSDFASNGQISPLPRHIFFEKSNFTLSCNTNTPYSLEDLGKIWKSFVVDSNFIVCRSYTIDFNHLDPLISKIFAEKRSHLTAV